MELLYWGHGPNCKNEKIRPHRHSYTQIEIILYGVCRCQNSADDILLKAGDAVIVPFNVEHSFANRSDDLEFLSFKVKIDKEYCQPQRIYKIPHDPFVDWIINDFRELARTKRYKSSPMYLELMHTLLEALLNHLDRNDLLVPGNPLLLSIREKILKYGARCDINTLAELLKVSVYKLRRDFKKAVRELPAGSIHCNSLKMLIKSELLAIACKHLRESDVKISEISDMLRFNNVYTFSRFIKNNTGLSPSSYRKKYHRQE
ncbi:MAG: helix-turn-helix domain-containing protein, partial [Lentisphaeria bacterium]|nr:helix-turn-helix domain-containing protein [Lentisphaeria bacterium]MBR7145803.1 helix-turn-helix domain-containing protein [Lentisphaeria bacterium]